MTAFSLVFRVFVGLGWLLSAGEGPLIHVRAPSRLELAAPRRAELGVRLGGRLVDDDTGEPVSGASLVAELWPEGDPVPVRRGLLSGADGGFSIEAPLGAGHHHIALRFGGDGTHDPVQLTREVDVGLRPLELSIEGPTRVRRGERATFRIRALTGGLPADVAVDVAGAPVRMRDGAAEVEVVAQGRGPTRLTARYGGDAIFGSAWAEARYTVLVPVQVSLEPLLVMRVARGEPLPLSGRIADADGPLPLAAVDIRVLGQPIGVAQADVGGRFAINLPTRRLPAGRLEIDAAFRPSASWHAPAQSAPLRLELDEPRSPPLWAFALPALVTLLGLLGWRGGRMLASRPRHPARRRPAPVAPPMAAGVRFGATPGGGSADDLMLEGVVLDARTSRPLADARVQLGGVTVETSTEGRFTLVGVAGRGEVVIEADGCLPERFACELPHGGMLRGLEVRLVPVRMRVLAEFQVAAAPLVGDPGELLVRTPAELAPRGGPALAELAALVEETSWSGRPTEVEQATRARVLREQAAPRETASRPRRTP
jgi:hypothetical protein